MFGGTDGYVKDVTAGVFATAYLPLLGATVAAMLAPPDGGKRVLIFIVLTVCSDIGGYFAGITLTPFTGGHKMAPVISPKKTWEGLAGSAFLCIVAGAIMLPALLHGHWWQGVITGIAAVAAAVFGDLAESMIKRDLAHQGHGLPAARPRRHPRPHRLPARLRPASSGCCSPLVRIKIDQFAERLRFHPSRMRIAMFNPDFKAVDGGQTARPIWARPSRNGDNGHVR